MSTSGSVLIDLKYPYNSFKNKTFTGHRMVITETERFGECAVLPYPPFFVCGTYNFKV